MTAQTTDATDLGLLRDSVRKLAELYGHTYYAEKTKTGGPMSELVEEIFSAGYGSVLLPSDFGGGGGGIEELCVVIEEFSRVGCPVERLVISPTICGLLVLDHGTDEQQCAWLPGIASGEIQFSFAITEPDAGSNSRNVSTTATRRGEDWVINGQKTYITGVDESQAMVLFTRTEGMDGAPEQSLFIVDTDAPGLTKVRIPMALRTPMKQFTLFFDDVVVPADRLIGGDPGLAFRQIFTGLNAERITVASQQIGLGRYALDKAVSYANSRIVWNVPIGTHQGLSHPLAAARIAVEVAAIATTSSAKLFDQRQDLGQTANYAKYVASEAAINAFDIAIQVHGGSAYTVEAGLLDLSNFCRLARSAPVSREMIFNGVANGVMGLPRSY